MRTKKINVYKQQNIIEDGLSMIRNNRAIIIIRRIVYVTIWNNK